MTEELQDKSEDCIIDCETDEIYEDLRNAKLHTVQGDPEIAGLIGKWDRKILNLQPEYQRHFVWKKDKSSLLIESVLMNIPLPVFYFSEEENGTETVIDGQQRLTSFFSFIRGKFPDGTDFRLSGLKVHKELNGKNYEELSSQLRDKIFFYKIRTITFQKESNKNLKFEIFLRLNTGAVALNEQELRNCMFRGKFKTLLKELTKHKDFLYLVQDVPKLHERMKDQELVLRFAAFYLNGYEKYKASMRRFLNNTMEEYQDICSEDEERLTKSFKKAMELIKSLLGDRGFKRFTLDPNTKEGKWETKFNFSLYDILLVSFANADKNIVYQHLDEIREALMDLMTTDEEFIEAIHTATSNSRAVKCRFSKWQQILSSILESEVKSARCFSYDFKQQLYDAKSTCEICGNKIQSIDDSAVDHIQQYWQGGQTIPENARLTHRYCNNARKRKEY